MDGNNRWSKKKNISLFNGYKYGADKLFKIAEFIFKSYSVDYISAFALSKHNLNRKKSTVNALNKTLSFYIKELSSKNTLDFKISFKGDLTFLSAKQKEALKRIELINSNSNKILYLFLNYSGKLDIINAAKKFNQKKNRSNNFEDMLITKGIPNPELLIRTGGYCRISDFMLFQIAFTELFFLKKLWPDISINDIKKMFDSYFKIERKFGL